MIQSRARYNIVSGSITFMNFTYLDIPDNLTVALSDELNLHLGTLTLGASSAQNLDDPREGDAGLFGKELRGAGPILLAVGLLRWGLWST